MKLAWASRRTLADFTGSNASTTESGMFNGLQRASPKSPLRSMALMVWARETPQTGQNKCAVEGYN
jgi:hypothetical protein